MFTVSEADREEVIARCKEFLAKDWIEANAGQIECERITSGVANKTFHVWIKEMQRSESKSDHENKDVIVRIYNSGIMGKMNKIKFNGEIGELLIHQRLHEVGLASQLLGVFDGGLIEQYIPSRPTNVDDLNSIELSKEVVRKVAKLHSLTMPVSKKPNLIEHVASRVKEAVVPPNYSAKYPNEIEDCELIVKFNFEKEMQWIRQMLQKVGQKVVFSHNDVNPNNILLKKNAKDGDKILLVDYEMSGYFYRAYDLAYFLRMKRARIIMGSNKLEFTIDEEDYSTTDVLLQEYLNEYRKLNGGAVDAKYDNLDRLRMEVMFLDLVYNMFIVGMVKAVLFESLIPIPLAIPARATRDYRSMKQRLINKYGDPIDWK